MKYYFSIIVIIIASLFAQEQTFKLKDGTVIIGKVQEETDLTMQVETKFGIVTISKNELKPTNSQNKYIIIKLSERTIPFIEKVNKPKNA